MYPFGNYEIVKGILEEMRVISERRYWLRRAERDVAPAPQSMDAEVIQFLAKDNEDEQARIGA